jgi:hypothetical protein
LCFDDDDGLIVISVQRRRSTHDNVRGAGEVVKKGWEERRCGDERQSAHRCR